MTIKRNKKETNSFTIEGLTRGQLYAIKHAFEFKNLNGTLSPVGSDVMKFLQVELAKPEVQKLN